MFVFNSTIAERAEKIVADLVPRHLIAVDRIRLAEAIRRLVVENATEEVQKRRDAENALDSCKGGVILVCTDEGTTMRAWNSKTKRWYEVPMREQV